MINRRPNLVFVFPDQMRGSAMSFLGIEPVATPCLDAFSRQSLQLSQCASTYPVCSPYRAMLMSGQYPHRTGMLGNCNSNNTRFDTELPTQTRCWSDVLADEGYSLGYIGKWHLDAPREPYIDCANNRGELKWNEWCPPHRRHGFDFWYGYGTYDQHMRPMYWRGDAPRDGFHFVDQWGPEHEADMAIEYLRNTGGKYRKADAPFAMVVSMNPPHTPYKQRPDRYRARYDAMDVEQLCTRPDIPPAGTRWGDHFRNVVRDYYAMITGVDEQFGRIVKAIDDLGLAEDTLVVFTSDHGDCTGIHEFPHKSVWWEASMQVPFMARFPGRLSPGVDDLLIASPDIYPTLLGLMGLGHAIPGSVMGTDMSSIMRGQRGAGPRPTSQLYQWLTPRDPKAGARGVRTHDYKLVIAPRPAEANNELNPLIGESAPEMFHLYDRRTDPFELKNIAGEQPQIVRQLIADELEPWLKRAEDPFAVSEWLTL